MDAVDVVDVVAGILAAVFDFGSGPGFGLGVRYCRNGLS